MEFILTAFELVLIFSVFGKGLETIIKSNNTWPLDGCKTGKFDLVFVADASIAHPFDKSKTKRQMSFFSRMIDVFSPPTEEILDRLRVSLMVASRPTSDSATIDLRLEFDAITQKSALKDKVEGEVMNFEPFTDPMKAFGFINVIKQNKTINKVRADATLVVVMFGGHESENDSNLLEDIREDMKTTCGNFSAKLFMIVIKNRNIISLDINGDIALYKVPDITYHLLNTMPLLICNQCFLHWFGNNIELSSNINDTLTLSCYKLGQADQKLSWFDASDKCWTEGTRKLASIETQNKAVSLSEQLIRQFENLRDLDTDLDSVAVYIGLHRLQSTASKRFGWMNGNPLVYSNWGPFQPRGGLTHRCGMWELSNVTYILNASEDGRKKRDMKDKWSTVGCDETNARFYLCESTVKIKLSSTQWSKFTLPRAAYENFISAIARAELGFISKSNNLMSLSALLKYWKSEDTLSDSYTYVNGNVSQTVPLSDVQLYRCSSNDGSIPYTSVCDFSSDCPDRSDELFCRKCSGDEFLCRSSDQCVSESGWCDLSADCRDGDDERDCFSCGHGLCADGRCLLKHLFADGEIDCFECSSDDSITFEMNYVQKENISHCLFTCNRTACVYEWMLNNGVVDCTGIEGQIDETVGALESTTCYTELDSVTSRFSNWGPKCFYIRDIYREPLGCRNMRHLQDCYGFICPEGYYKCPQSYCIPTHYIRDGSNDCPFGEDEDFDKYSLICPLYFRCQFPLNPGNLGLCLHPILVCDGRKDCPEGEDELNCRVPCAEGFRCLAGTVIVQDLNSVNNSLNPSLFDANTRYLDLSGIDLSQLFPTAFLQHFLNLNDVRMSSCKIVSTDMRITICNLGTVRGIDLSYNNITNVTSVSIFWCMRNLHYLNLSHNELLTNFQINGHNLQRLKILDLSFTGVFYLIPETFSFIDGITNLNLQNSRISNMSFLPQTNIQNLDLRGTPVNNLPYPEMFQRVIITSQLLTDSYKLCCPQLHNSSTNSRSCISTKDPFSSCSDLMSNTVLRVILWINGVFAVLGNLAVIIYRLFFDRRIFKLAYGHFVTQLSISDFLMGVYLLIIATADRWYRDMYLWEERSWRNSTFCSIAGFLSTLSMEVSTFYIFLITLDRFLVIRYPFGQYRIAGKIAAIICGVTWIIGFVIAILPILPLFTYLNVYSTNSMCLGLPLKNDEQSGQEFAVSVFILFNFVMFILIAFGQIAIYKTVCVMRINQGSLTNLNCRRTQDLALAKNLGLVVFTDFLCYFPIGILGIMTICGYKIDVQVYSWMAAFVMPINSAINPLLYTVPVLVKKVSTYAENISRDRSRQQ